MSDTPRTDAAKHNIGNYRKPRYVVDVQVARQLERELANVADHPIARLQVGPDGLVPSGTVDALWAWKAEADRLWLENQRFRKALEHIERITFKESVGDIAREALFMEGY
jgi:hypothetical protein